MQLTSEWVDLFWLTQFRRCRQPELRTPQSRMPSRSRRCSGHQSPVASNRTRAHSSPAAAPGIITTTTCFRFYVPQLVPAGTAEARISYGNSVCLSVRLSVTTRYGFNARWDRDSGSSPYGSLEYLVSYEVIWCQWVKRFPSNKGIKEGYPP